MMPEARLPLLYIMEILSQYEKSHRNLFYTFLILRYNLFYVILHHASFTLSLNQALTGFITLALRVRVN